MYVDQKEYNITPIVSKIVWSGDLHQSGRKLNLSLYNTRYDKSISEIPVKNGAWIYFYEDEKDKSELFRGKIKLVQFNSGNSLIEASAFDIGSILTQKIGFNTNNEKIKNIPSLVCKKLGLEVGKIANVDGTISKLFNGVSGYDAIMSAYMEAAKSNDKKYMIAITQGKVNVIEKGVTTTKVAFKEGKNLISSTYESSIENMINRIIAVDDKGNQTAVQENKELIELFGVMQEVAATSQDNKEEKEKSEIRYPEQTCSLEGFGDTTSITGNKVQVTDSISGLTGEFYIDSDTHTWENGTHRIQLKLNFENIMDEKSVEKKKEEAAGAMGSEAKDWGHGITADMINKVLKGKLAGKGDLFVKYCNMYKVNPAVLAAIACNESAYGTSHLALANNNFFGMRTRKDGWLKFNSVEEGIKRGISNISRNYISKGLNSYQKMVSKYAESGSAWIPTNEGILKKITGKTSSQLQWGSGVKSDDEAMANLVPVSTSGGGGSAAVQVGMRHMGEHRFKSYFHEGLWCADFVSYCLKQSGTYPFRQSTSSCVGLFDLYQKAGRSVRGNRYTPKPGDAIFFKFGGSRGWTNHVGLVKAVVGNRIVTVEGNTSDIHGRYTTGVVNSHTYKIGYGNIVGFGKN